MARPALPRGPYGSPTTAMALLAFGINHKTAPVDIRERVAFAPERMGEALSELTADGQVDEAVILSTCNRTEIYCNVLGGKRAAVESWLSRFHNIPQKELGAFVYAHSQKAAIQHVLRVASGLDSLVLGEPQILGQMKTAFATAQDAGTIGKLLNRLFQHTFMVAKQVRTDTAIGSSPVSVAFAAVSLARQIFGDLKQSTVLLIGAGETIELTARHLHENGIGRMIVANRTVERAHQLANEFHGYAIALQDIPEHLPEADIVISSTASPLPILGKGAVESALRRRKHRPMFMVDIAVPRDIEAEVADLEDVYLYTVDDLREVIEENVRSRREAAMQAEEIVETQASHFMDWLRAQDAVDVIRVFRSQADQLRDEMLEKARAMLSAGQEADHVLEVLATQLTNKLTHQPCVQLREAATREDRQTLELARSFYGLHNDTSDTEDSAAEANTSSDASRSAS